MLIVVGIGCFVGAWFSYTRHPVTDSNLYAPEIPGWMHLFIFIFIGVLVRLAYIGGGRRGTKKDNEGDAARKT
jgi:hypothetical protein